MFTIEQIELIRRLRNSGITKEQVVEAFERFDRIDQELGHLYTVPSSSASPTVNQQSSLQAPSIPSASVGQPPLAHSSNSASHGHSMLLSRSNGQYPLYSGSRPSFSSSSPQSDNGQSDLKPPSNKRPREESTETNHEESMQEIFLSVYMISLSFSLPIFHVSLFFITHFSCLSLFHYPFFMSLSFSLPIFHVFHIACFCVCLSLI
ncbi:unnamed protein product [Acanthosepion pharaonis]|uniref:HNF-p1 domain-containing protein n=1 Tax=Acanthosepion pharaonis TaxID=158019 RepID=A0A812E710_ACAPH|nr:unnamed protein product [Sepia pharaonis]